jgi:ribosome-associated toxin RatA of RatAB toxin-antitoxin module
MADQASATLTINASKAEVMAVIADFEAYPEWSSQIKAVTIDEKGDDGRPAQVTFSLDAGVIKDEYTLNYTWQGDDRVDWHLVKSKALKSQDGSYQLKDAGQLTDAGDATEVTYTLAVDLNIPMLGMFKRKAEKVIIDTALKGLKKRVEGGA